MKKNRTLLVFLYFTLVLVIICMFFMGCKLNPKEVEKKTEAQNSPDDKQLVGLWSKEGPYGNMVDPSTGMSTGSVYNGEWYLFRDDGTFRHVIIGCGSIICGGVVAEGRFDARNGNMFFTNCKESWYPNHTRKDQKASYRDKPADSEQASYHLEVKEGTEILVLGRQNYFESYYRAKQ